MRLIKGCLALRVSNCINCKHCLECYGKYDTKKIKSALEEGFNCPKMDEGLFEDRLIAKKSKL